MPKPKRKHILLRVSPALAKKLDVMARKETRRRADGRKVSRNEVTTMVLVSALEGGVLDLPTLPSSLAGRTMENIEEEAVRETLKLTNGNRASAAKLLGIGERTLYRKIQKYDLDRAHDSGPSPRTPRHRVHISRDYSWDPKGPLESACATKWPQEVVTWRELHRVDCKRCMKTTAYLGAQLNDQQNEMG